MTNRWGEIETVADFIFLGSKITVDGDCSHEIKTCRPKDTSGYLGIQRRYFWWEGTVGQVLPGACRWQQRPTERSCPNSTHPSLFQVSHLLLGCGVREKGRSSAGLFKETATHPEALVVSSYGPSVSLFLKS